MTAPLEGIKVLDFGHYYAGPAVAMALADQGARVVHVDRPGAIGLRNDETLNRNKTRVTIDLKDEKGLEDAIDLVKWADILIENFRPGVASRLGIGYDDCRAVNPGIIYLSLPGFPSEDPTMRDTRAFEGVVMASGGAFMDLSINRALAGEVPTFTPLPLASAYAAANGAAAVMLALNSRERDGRGDHLEVDLYSSLLEGMGYANYLLEAEPSRYLSLREREFVRRRKAGQRANMDYEQILELQDPFFRTYECADGRPFYVVSLSHRNHPIRALEALGLLDEAKNKGLPMHDAYISSREWPGDDPCTVFAQPLNTAWTKWLTPRMKERFATRPAHEWEEIFHEFGAVGLAVRTMSEWLNTPYARESGLVVPVTHNDYQTHQMGPLVWLGNNAPRRPATWVSSTSDVQRPLPLEANGQDPARAVSSKGQPGEHVKQWAEGLKVVDLCNVIAGPTVGAMLARFGAEVTSIQPVRPAIDPWMNIVFGLRAHVGKRSCLVDLRQDEGRDILWKLLGGSDLLTMNMTEIQLRKLGLDLDDLQARFPKLIILKLDAFGGQARCGQYKDYLGYDELGQAMTGIMARFGGGLKEAELHAQVGAIDALTGVWSLFGTAVALYCRTKFGTGQVVRSSLTAVAQFLQLPYFLTRDGQDIEEGPGGRGLSGEGPLYRCYKAVDGSIFLAGLCEDMPDFCKAFGFSGDPHERRIEEVLEELTIKDIGERLVGTKIEIAPIRSGAQVRSGEVDRQCPKGVAFSAVGKRFIEEPDHPIGRPVTQVAPVAIRSATKHIERPSPSEKFGTSTRSVLLRLGYTQEEIVGFLRSGIAAEKWSEDYLPD